MNERIVDLYEQASSFASEEENSTKSYKDRVMIKFAQLIVAECAKVAVFKDSGMAASADVAGYMAAGRSTAAHMIKQHFGVEE